MAWIEIENLVHDQQSSRMILLTLYHHFEVREATGVVNDSDAALR
jgi:hypothetical protein